MAKSKCKTVYEFHPLASHYELLDGKEAEELKASIAAIGCRVPVVIYEDMILDGRNRWIICQELGVECPTTIYEGDEPELFVEAMNGHRRHLTDNARLLAAVALHKDREKRLFTAQNLRGSDGKHPRSNQCGERTLSSAAVERIAEESGKSERTVQMAAKVNDSCIPAIQDAVKAGEVSVSDAAAISDLPKMEQAMAIRSVKRGEAKTLKKAAGVTGGAKKKDTESDDKTVEPEKPKPIKDELGNDVPEKYRAAFDARSDFDAIGRELDAVRKKIEALAETPAGHYLEKELQGIKQSFKTLKGTFLWSKPHSLVPDTVRKGEPRWLSMYAYKQTDGAKA